MAKRSKFHVDENDVLDNKEPVQEKNNSDVENIETPDKKNEVTEEDTKKGDNGTSNQKVSKKEKKKTDAVTEPVIQTPPVEKGTAPAAQPGFSYKKKKEKRDVKKLLLITPTMNEQVTSLLENTYNGMPFNMLVNDLLKKFVEEHGIKIEDDTF